MFKVAVNEAFWAAVTVAIPADGDKVDTRKFSAQFKRLKQSELDEVMAKVSAGSITDQQLLDQVLINWREVGDEDGADMPFNPDNLAKACEVYPVRPSIVAAFFKSINGARQKN